MKNRLGISEYTGIFFSNDFVESYHEEISINGFDDSMDRIRVVDIKNIGKENDVIFNQLEDSELKEIRESRLRELLNDGFVICGHGIKSDFEKDFKLFKGTDSLFVEFWNNKEIFPLNIDMLSDHDIAWVVSKEKD